MRYQPYNNPSGDFDCYVVYTDTPIRMQAGKQYELIAETNWLRVNAYHKSTENTIYAYNIRIYAI